MSARSVLVPMLVLAVTGLAACERSDAVSEPNQPAEHHDGEQAEPDGGPSTPDVPGEHDAGPADAGPEEVHPDDGAVHDTSLIIPRRDITSPASIPRVRERPACDYASLGSAAITESTHLVDDEAHLVDQVWICSSVDDTYDWVAGPSEQPGFGLPVRNDWIGVIHFALEGSYEGSLTVQLLEGEAQFLSIRCQAGRTRAEELLRIDRDEPATVSCPGASEPGFAWVEAFGQLEIRTQADQPAALFHPAYGAPAVPISLFAL